MPIQFAFVGAGSGVVRWQAARRPPHHRIGDCSPYTVRALPRVLQLDYRWSER